MGDNECALCKEAFYLYPTNEIHVRKTCKDDCYLTKTRIVDSAYYDDFNDFYKDIKIVCGIQEQ